MELNFDNKPSVTKISDIEYIQIFYYPPSDNKVVIWNKQRILNEERAGKIAFESQNDKFTMGEIIAIKKKNTELLEVIDGQHRFFAYKKMYPGDLGLTKKLPPLIVHVYIVDTDEEIYSLFKRINKSEPVPDYYLNPLIKQTFINILEKYKETFNKNIKHQGSIPPRNSLERSNYINYLSEALYDATKDVAYWMLEKYIPLFDKELERILVENKELIDYVIENEIESEDTEEYIDKNIKGTRSRRIIKLFIELYPTQDEVEKQFKYSELYGSYIGIFAYPWDKNKKIQLLKNEFTISFWNFISYNQKQPNKSNNKKSLI